MKRIALLLLIMAAVSAALAQTAKKAAISATPENKGENLRVQAEEQPAAPPQVVAVAGERSAYIYWGPRFGGPHLYVVYRRGAEWAKVAEVAPVLEESRATAILRNANDDVARNLTLDVGFHEKADNDSAMDEGLALSSMGYAQVRGYAYYDRDLERGVTYEYRVAQVVNGQEKTLGTVRLTTGAPELPAAPVVTAAQQSGTPVLRWQATPFTTYEVRRAAEPNGVFRPITLVPLAAPPIAETMELPDANALLDGRTYYYKVIPYTLIGENGEPSSVVSVATADRTPPRPPQGVEISTTNRSIKLNWSRSSEPDAAGYRIFRSEVREGENAETATKALPLTKIPLGIGSTSYEDTDVLPGKVYRYQLSSIDKLKNESELSPAVLAVSRDRTPPARVTGLSVKATDGAARLTWNPSPDKDIYGYRIYRASGDGKLALAREISITQQTTSPSFEDKIDPRAQQTFRYAVSAVDKTENEGALSAEVSVRMNDVVSPAAPVITALKAGNGSVEVHWAPVADTDLDGYRVYRSDSREKAGDAISPKLPKSTTAWLDKSAQGGKVYHYTLAAEDNSTNLSPRSMPASTSTFEKPKAVAPRGLQVIGKRLTWTPSPGASAYVVYGDDPNGRYLQVTPARAETEFILPQPPAVHYRVQVIYKDGQVSELSAPYAVPAPRPAAKPSSTAKPKAATDAESPSGTPPNADVIHYMP